MKEIENMDTAASSAGRQAEDGPATSKRSRRTSRAQRVAYLRQWEASGQSAEAFAAGRPINAQSLYRWRMAEKSSKASGAGAREFPLRGRGKRVNPAPLTSVVESLPWLAYRNDLDSSVLEEVGGLEGSNRLPHERDRTLPQRLAGGATGHGDGVRGSRYVAEFRKGQRPEAESPMRQRIAMVQD